jgi:hypothetical protein
VAELSCSNFQTTSESVLLTTEAVSESYHSLAVKTRFRVVSGDYALDFELRDARWKKYPRFM